MYPLGHIPHLLLAGGFAILLVAGLMVMAGVVFIKLVVALVYLLTGKNPGCRSRYQPPPQPVRGPEVHRPAAPVMYPVRPGPGLSRRHERGGAPAWALLGVGLIFFCLVASGFRVKELIAADHKSRRAANVADAESSWTVVGRGATIEDARLDALDKASTQFLVYLRNQNPPLDWRPSQPLDYVRDHLTKEWNEESPRTFEEPVGRIQQVSLKVEVTPKNQREIVKLDLQDRREYRMIFLAEILGGLIVVLASVAGYVRLDEWSKGYYTGLLRLTAASFIGAAGAALWFLLRSQ